MGERGGGERVLWRDWVKDEEGKSRQGNYSRKSIHPIQRRRKAGAGKGWLRGMKERGPSPSEEKRRAGTVLRISEER